MSIEKEFLNKDRSNSEVQNNTTLKSVYCFIDNVSNNFLHSFFASNDAEAIRTFTAYAVGSSDLFVSDLMLCRLATLVAIGHDYTLHDCRFQIVCYYSSISGNVETHRKQLAQQQQQ